MVKHVAIYHNYFEIDPHSPRRCELTGRTSKTEIHHIEARGMGGRESMDYIGNLMCLCREAHVFFGDIVKYKDWLKEVHLKYMFDGIPFEERPEEHEFMEEFLAQYVPMSPKRIYGDPYIIHRRKDVWAYLFGHLAKLAKIYLRDKCGYGHIFTKEQAADQMKFICGYYDIIDEEKIPLSFRTGDFNRLVYFVQELYIFLNDNGMNPVPPDKNWKKNG